MNSKAAPKTTRTRTETICLALTGIAQFKASISPIKACQSRTGVNETSKRLDIRTARSEVGMMTRETAEECTRTGPKHIANI